MALAMTSISNFVHVNFQRISQWPNTSGLVKNIAADSNETDMSDVLVETGEKESQSGLKLPETRERRDGNVSPDTADPFPGHNGKMRCHNMSYKCDGHWRSRCMNRRQEAIRRRQQLGGADRFLLDLYWQYDPLLN